MDIAARDDDVDIRTVMLRVGDEFLVMHQRKRAEEEKAAIRNPDAGST